MIPSLGSKHIQKAYFGPLGNQRAERAERSGMRQKAPFTTGVRTWNPGRDLSIPLAAQGHEQGPLLRL